MCALFDDLFGWVGFASNGTVRPWSGFTAQVDVSLVSPVRVGAVLRMEGGFSGREGPRKVRVWGGLVDLAAGGRVRARGKGLFILKKISDEAVDGENLQFLIRN